jgi:hypothetical protein
MESAIPVGSAPGSVALAQNATKRATIKGIAANPEKVA